MLSQSRYLKKIAKIEAYCDIFTQILFWETTKNKLGELEKWQQCCMMMATTNVLPLPN